MTVSVDEAAEILGIGRGLAYDLVRTGKIPSIRLSKRWLVPRKAIDRILQIGATPPEKTSGIV